ncbi:MAG: protease [Patescibacteria group bacterium]|nr:protease [Patescibacteria group bacterium]MDQ5971644.1 protease [Patescibacteria group bacterium]
MNESHSERKALAFYQKHRHIINGIGIFVLFFALGCASQALYYKFSNNQVYTGSDTTDDDCSVVGINLHGTLLTYTPVHADNDPAFNYDSVASEEITYKIKQANKDEDIKAIILEVDSGGGVGVAGEEVSNAVKSSAKPVIGLIRTTGASAAYFAISSADRIFASKFSDIGGIGVTASYLSNVQKNQKDGLNYEQLTAGKYKDSGRPDKPLTQDEKNLFLRDINIGYEYFVKAISENRKIAIDKVRVIADGSTVMGAQAMKIGLIDEVGGMDEVEKYIEETTGEKPEICWK